MIKISMSTDGQQSHEKMLNVVNYQKNANQNYKEALPHSSHNDHHFKNLHITNAGENGKERESSYIVAGDVNW